MLFFTDQYFHIINNCLIFALRKLQAMKKETHPENYRPVIFKDISIDKSWLTMSTVNTKDTEVWEDGNEYPLVKLEISNLSHPFFTGKMKFVDTAGRIDKFNKKFSKFASENPASDASDDETEDVEGKTEEQA
jgi:large subunit ribosomal protein L31